MRIGFIAHGLSNGGAERVESILANFLAQNGHEVLFIAALSAEKTYELDERVIYKHRPAKSNNMIIKLIQKNINVYRDIKNFKADVIISFLTNEAFLVGLTTNAPIICTLRNDPYNYNNTSFKKIIRKYLFKISKKVVFQTIGAKNYFDEDIRSKGVIIGNPLKSDLPYWKDYPHEKWIITACRLEKQKNIPMMLESFAEFKKRFPEYCLKICGTGQLLNELESYAEELNIRDSVDFLGFQSDVHDIMARSEMFILTSDYEGVSNSMLEALSMGMPVVCTDSSPGGAATYINDGVNGVLIPVGDTKAFNNAMVKVISDTNFKKQISTEAVNIRNELDINRILEMWKSVIIEE